MVMSAVSSVARRRVGHGDAALHGSRHVDVVDAVAEIGDQLQSLAGLAEHGSVDVVGDRRDDDVGGLRRLDELRLTHRLVVGIEAGVEQFAHAHFDAVRQPAGDHDQRLLARRHLLPLRADRPERNHNSACNFRLLQ